MASKLAQIQGVTKPEERGVLFRTPSDEGCSATQLLNFFRSHTIKTSPVPACIDLQSKSFFQTDSKSFRQ